MGKWTLPFAMLWLLLLFQVLTIPVLTQGKKSGRKSTIKWTVSLIYAAGHRSFLHIDDIVSPLCESALNSLLSNSLCSKYFSKLTTVLACLLNEEKED